LTWTAASARIGATEGVDRMAPLPERRREALTLLPVQQTIGRATMHMNMWRGQTSPISGQVNVIPRANTAFADAADATAKRTGLATSARPASPRKAGASCQRPLASPPCRGCRFASHATTSSARGRPNANCLPYLPRRYLTQSAPAIPAKRKIPPSQRHGISCTLRSFSDPLAGNIDCAQGGPA
jgi:hypothetical protein